MSWDCERCDRNSRGGDQTPRCCDACLAAGWRMPFVDSSDEACGLAFDYGREQGGLELQRVMLDKMEAESGNETIARLSAENQLLRRDNARLWKAARDQMIASMRDGIAERMEIEALRTTAYATVEEFARNGVVFGQEPPGSYFEQPIILSDDAEDLVRQINAPPDGSMVADFNREARTVTISGRQPTYSAVITGIDYASDASDSAAYLARSINAAPVMVDRSALDAIYPRERPKKQRNPFSREQRLDGRRR